MKSYKLCCKRVCLQPYAYPQSVSLLLNMGHNSGNIFLEICQKVITDFYELIKFQDCNTLTLKLPITTGADNTFCGTILDFGNKNFLLTIPRWYFFLDHLCHLCLVFVMLSRLFIAALWSPEGKGLTSWLLFVMFIVILLLSHLVSWDSCGT